MPVLLQQEIVQEMSAQLNKKGKMSLWDGKGVLCMMESKKVVNIIITSRQMDKIGNITLYNADCMEVMKSFADKEFDLALVDPPYGINATKMTLGNGKRKLYRGESNWDLLPPQEEFWKELMRVSKNQIVFGANHFIHLIPIDSSCWIVWDKGTGDNDFADCELAWTSFQKPVRKYFQSWVGNNAKEKGGERFHPTQKPINLYSWILNKFAATPQKILDPFGGSMSSMIACYRGGV